MRSRMVYYARYDWVGLIASYVILLLMLTQFCECEILSAVQNSEDSSNVLLSDEPSTLSSAMTTGSSVNGYSWCKSGQVKQTATDLAFRTWQCPEGGPKLFFTDVCNGLTQCRSGADEHACLTVFPESLNISGHRQEITMVMFPQARWCSAPVCYRGNACDRVAHIQCQQMGYATRLRYFGVPNPGVVALAPGALSCRGDKRTLQSCLYDSDKGLDFTSRCSHLLAVECMPNCLFNSRTFTTEGNISSPGYPDFLLHNLDCRWEFQAAEHLAFVIQFLTINLETTTNGLCSNSYIQVGLGPKLDNASMPIYNREYNVVQFCDDSYVLKNLTTSISRFWVRFVSGQERGPLRGPKGFFFRYFTVPITDIGRVGVAVGISVVVCALGLLCFCFTQRWWRRRKEPYRHVVDWHSVIDYPDYRAAQARYRKDPDTIREREERRQMLFSEPLQCPSCRRMAYCRKDACHHLKRLIDTVSLDNFIGPPVSLAKMMPYVYPMLARENNFHYKNHSSIDNASGSSQFLALPSNRSTSRSKHRNRTYADDSGSYISLSGILCSSTTQDDEHSKSDSGAHADVHILRDLSCSGTALSSSVTPSSSPVQPTYLEVPKPGSRVIKSAPQKLLRRMSSELSPATWKPVTTSTPNFSRKHEASMEVPPPPPQKKGGRFALLRSVSAAVLFGRPRDKLPEDPVCMRSDWERPQRVYRFWRTSSNSDSMEEDGSVASSALCTPPRKPRPQEVRVHKAPSITVHPGSVKQMSGDPFIPRQLRRQVVAEKVPRMADLSEHGESSSAGANSSSSSDDAVPRNDEQKLKNLAPFMVPTPPPKDRIWCVELHNASIRAGTSACPAQPSDTCNANASPLSASAVSANSKSGLDVL